MNKLSWASHRRVIRPGLDSGCPGGLSGCMEYPMKLSFLAPLAALGLMTAPALAATAKPAAKPTPMATAKAHAKTVKTTSMKVTKTTKK